MIFLSYPRQRVALAHLIKLSIELRGHKVFMDLTELAGGDWNQQLRNAIQKSSDVVVLLTQESLSSSAIAAEMDYAHSLKKAVIPVIVDELSSQGPAWVQSSMKFQAIAFDERFPSVGVEQIVKNLKAKRSVVPIPEMRKFEFIKEFSAITASIVLAIIAFATTPDAQAHLSKIQRSAYADYQLDKEFFFTNNVVFSEVYVVGEGNQQIVFSYGIFGRIFETDAFNYNLKKRLGLTGKN
jgi:TIR domain